jgi:amino acid transporter
MAILAWSVMQGISEMLCIWPISGALYEYVSVFVDPEIGEAVGIAYWFTNAMGFAAIMMTASGEVEYWSTNGYLKGFLILSGVPAMLVGINTLGVELYGWIELVGGSLKLSFVLTIIVTTLAIVLGAGQDSQSVASKWNGSHYDMEAAKNHPIAFFMCLPIAAFAFVGIEITAATALEAKASTRRQIVPTTRLKRPATKLPLVVGTIYVLAAIMIALAVDANSPSLPPQGWVSPLIPSTSKSDSAFVQAAEAAQIHALPSVITAFIVFTALTAANTALYVASRTLFGLARESGSWFGYFGVTDGTHRVPLRALWASAIFFFVGYFCYLPSQNGVNAVSYCQDILQLSLTKF